ncbi:putative T7SS-secreted protein [Streptomyces sp. NPDC049954]|uniref:putative T7SS-secreted protein n=1 Tax=Streptomyces sp. NPDC049954 TaxID=3155779 RepID=UPI00341DB11B
MLDLDRDPVPGDPRRVRKLAASLHDFADDVAQVLRDIKGMAGEDAILSWAGKTADSFIEEFQEAPGKLKKLKKSYDLAGDALASYWPDLESAQDKADKALRDARTARADLASAHSALGTANEGVRTADAKADSYDPDKNQGRDIPKPDEAEVRRATRNATHARERQQAAQGRVEDAQSALEAAKRLAEQARGLRQEAARRTVKKIEDASDAGIPNRHWWEEAVDWVADHWDEIVTVCKWVVTIVGLIVMIVGGPLGWLVFAAALVVMADTIRKVINGEAGWGDLIWAALDCIPATKGFTSMAKLGKLWKAGGLRALGGGALKGIGGGLKNLAGTLRGLGAGAKTIVRGLPGALGELVKVAVTPEGLRIPVLDPGAFRALMSAGGDAAGAARNTPRVPAGVPHDRHSLDRIRPNTVKKKENSVVLPHVDVKADIEAINDGLALRQGNDYTVNGRTYRVEGAHTYPIAGDGIVQMDRGAFRALQLMIEHGGDEAATALQLERERISPAQIQQAREVFASHKSQR